MRTREEIKKMLNDWKTDGEKQALVANVLSTELLLDIRELLMNPPVEIQGVEDRNLSELNHQ